MLQLVHEIIKDVFVLKKTNKEASIILGGHGQSGNFILFRENIKDTEFDIHSRKWGYILLNSRQGT